MFPQLEFSLNGGIRTFEEAQTLLNRESFTIYIKLMCRPKLKRKVRGVMIGRSVMQNPWLFRHADELFYHSTGPNLTRREILNRYIDYVERLEEKHSRDVIDNCKLVIITQTIF